MNIDILLSFALATSALAISPGPDNIYVLVQSIANGKSYGIATVCGLITGCIIHTSLLAFGVSAIIASNEKLFFGIKLLGAIYLIYLAYLVFKSDASLSFDSDNVPKKSLKQLFIQGFFMNVLNPKVIIFFLAFFPGFLFSDSMSTVIQFYILGGIFMLVSFIIFVSIALLAGNIKTYTMTHKNSGLVLKWLQIVVFVGIAVFILL
ncbi:threonine/homoserine/homoserine lactone efflux protein [Winogradskyella epiphytica]|uniref:Threonine/homoserine/homoserine lactone efflux protein n=1 Tax=Winogradskyella epiphytica TaxID=262005 RepID=A0A2V4XXF2_9FLAO|nr:LysE family translocator [Winogradskyella epiphytica]PYE80323.1 threonine/homoserine/homoserine lactone efflux protein [Winogradskyella epiphytica]GGW70565.1 threonine transporter RhtB [Winogradskyella epiphytica]